MPDGTTNYSDRPCANDTNQVVVRVNDAIHDKVVNECNVYLEAGNQVAQIRDDGIALESARSELSNRGSRSSVDGRIVSPDSIGKIVPAMISAAYANSLLSGPEVGEIGVAICVRENEPLVRYADSLTHLHLSYSGRGDSVKSGIRLLEGLYVVTASHSGSSNFIIGMFVRAEN